MTFKNFDEYIASNRSEKIVLAHVHGVKRLYGFEADGDYFSKTTPNFVVGIRQGRIGADLTRVETLEDLISDTQFYYDIPSSKLYLFSHDPELDEVIVMYRFFFSNAPINLSWDLKDDSPEVEYSPRIQSSPQFKSQMSQGKSGISLIGSGNLILDNNDGALSRIYNTIIWDNKDLNVFSYNRDLNPSAAKLIFRGIVTSKSFATDKVSFGAKDSLYLLEAKVPLNQHGDSVREADSLIFKRKVYGKVNNLLCQSIDQVGSGIPLQGTLSGTYGDTVVIGQNTKFLEELSPGDTLTFKNFTLTVDDVKSDTILTVSSLEVTFYKQTVTYIPSKHYNNKNRTFLVADHALKRFSTPITAITSRNRIIVEDPTGFADGDIVTLGNETKNIRRISGNTVVLQTNFNFAHSPGDLLSKTEITNTRFGSKGTALIPESVIIDNSPTGTTITIGPTAEFDVAKEQSLKYTFTFVNGRSSVWLGSPTLINLTCVGNVKTGEGAIDWSLYGKYFSMRDELGYEIGFWFKDKTGNSLGIVPKPSEILTIEASTGGRSKAIELEFKAYSASEIAALVQAAVTGEIGVWSSSTPDVNIPSSTIFFETTDSVNVNLGSNGNSGFTQSKPQSGSAVGVPQFNLSDILSTRDFVKASEDTSDSYFEVLSVTSNLIKLRKPYSGTTKATSLNFKIVDYIQDDSPVYVDCLGKTKDNTPSGEFIETCPQMVYDLLKEVGLGSRLDEQSFEVANQRSPYAVSMAIPLKPKDKQPAAKDIINRLNQSCLGSIFVNDKLDLGYDILDASTSAIGLNVISEDDIISWTAQDDGFDLSATNVGNYRFSDYDPVTGEESNKQVSFTSTFVQNYSQSTNTNEKDLYLFVDQEAQEVCERDQFINDLSSSTFKIKGSLSLAKLKMGERVILDLKGLYTSYGSVNNSKRIGLITSINNTGIEVNLDIQDLGAMFVRAARIADDSTPDFYNLDDGQRVGKGFITENNGVIGNEEETAGLNLIS